MANLARMGLIVALGYGAVVGFAYLFQRKLMYFPNPVLPPPDRTRVPEMAEVWIQAEDGTRVFAWYRPAPPGRPTIVLFHGNAGNISHRDVKARFLLDRGYGVLMPEYRGYGRSAGTPGEAGLLSDGRAALGFLAANGIDDGRIVLYGESLGSGVAVPLAGERGVAAVILEAPFTSTVDVAARAYPFLPVRALVKDRFDNLGAIGAVRAPILIIHGERDTVVPPALSARLAEAADTDVRRVVIPGAGHNDVFAAGGAQAVGAFLEDLFGAYSERD